ncbi:MAG TPA: PPOX class F420-dependent oxidoreductase [Actinomycetota bacterium]|nr:PPOX class F420-dependent oxidoreductase [Actinomycetota bacterium]
MIDSDIKQLASGPNFAVLTTILPGGQPQAHVMWVDCDDDHVLINTEIHRQKFRNVQRDPRVTLAIWDQQNPYKFVEVRGRVEETVGGQTARDHIDSLSMKYHGKPYSEKAIQSERVILRISPTRKVARG